MSEFIDKALLLMNTRTDLAVKELKQGLAENPEHSFAHALLAQCYLILDDTTRAFTEAKEAIRLNPELPYNFWILAQYYLKVENYLEAEVTIEVALTFDPLNSDYLWLLGLCQVNQGELKEALQTVELSLENDAEHVNCHSLRAYILNRMGKAAESDTSNKNALALEPEDAWSHALRGWCLYERHQYPEALQHFRESLRIDPNLDWAKQGLIHCLPTQHWIFQLHLKLRNKYAGLFASTWFIFNFILCCNHEALKQIWILVCAYLSWLLLILFIGLIFLPDSLISGPLMRFLIQFEPDGKYILTPQERKLNHHLLFFIALGTIGILAALISHVWMPLVAAILCFGLSRPFLLAREDRKPRTWVLHVVFTLLACGLAYVFINNQYGGQILRNIALINVFKYAAGAQIFKVVGGLLGFGVLKQALKQKKKAAVKNKILGQTRS